MTFYLITKFEYSETTFVKTLIVIFLDEQRAEKYLRQTRDPSYFITRINT